MCFTSETHHENLKYQKKTLSTEYGGRTPRNARALRGAPFQIAEKRWQDVQTPMDGLDRGHLPKAVSHVTKKHLNMTVADGGELEWFLDVLKEMFPV